MGLLPEELDHPIRDLHAPLPSRDVHLGQSGKVGDEPPLPG
jgi:hypothetical protein